MASLKCFLYGAGGIGARIVCVELQFWSIVMVSFKTIYTIWENRILIKQITPSVRPSKPAVKENL